MTNMSDLVTKEVRQRVPGNYSQTEFKDSMDNSMLQFREDVILRSDKIMYYKDERLDILFPGISPKYKVEEFSEYLQAILFCVSAITKLG